MLLSRKFKNSDSNARASCHFVSQLFVGESGIFENFCEILKHQLGSSCTSFTSTAIQLVSLVKWSTTLFLANPLPFCTARLGWGIWTRSVKPFLWNASAISLNLELLNVNSSFSLENGSEEKVLQGSGFLPDQCLRSMIFPFTKKVGRAFKHLNWWTHYIYATPGVVLLIAWFDNNISDSLLNSFNSLNSFPIILDPLEHKMIRKKFYRIICVENNEYEGFKSDQISFRVDNTIILWSDANWGRKVKTELLDFKTGLATLWRFQGPVNILFE